MGYYRSGFQRQNHDGSTTLENGRLPLFSHFDEHGTRSRARIPCSIDSGQLERGDALDDHFRGMAADEIDRFRREIADALAIVGPRKA
jgi:type III restriction enzyme